MCMARVPASRMSPHRQLWHLCQAYPWPSSNTVSSLCVALDTVASEEDPSLKRRRSAELRFWLIFRSTDQPLTCATDQPVASCKNDLPSSVLKGGWEIPKLNGGWIRAGKIIQINGELSIAMFDYWMVSDMSSENVPTLTYRTVTAAPATGTFQSIGLWRQDKTRRWQDGVQRKVAYKQAISPRCKDVTLWHSLICTPKKSNRENNAWR